VKVSVSTATTESDFIVVLHLTCIWGVLFEVDHSAGFLVRIFGETFGVSKVDSFVGVESLCEFVTVVHTEDTRVNLEVHGHHKVFPGVAVSRSAVLGDFVALEENTLGKTSVLLSVLNDMDGIIFEVVHHSALVDTEVLLRALNDGLLEVGAEAEYLSVVLEPFGSDLRDGIVLMGGALGYTRARHGGSLSHGVQHFLVDGLFKSLGLFTDGTIFDSKELRLVVAGNGGVGINIAGKHGKASGEILRLHVLDCMFFFRVI
jgi:hypothetical protein